MQSDLSSQVSTAAHNVQQEEESLRLVAAIAKGDLEAENDFVRRYWPPVGVMLLARSRDPDLTSDLQQSTMLEALCALRRGQLRDPSKLAGFVAGIARNLLNKHLQRKKRAPEWDELTEDTVPFESGVSLIDPLDECRRREVAERAIAALDPIDRSILLMTLVEGLKSGTVAKRLHMNPSVVRQRKMRATRRAMEFVQRLLQKPSPNHFLSGRRRNDAM